MLEIRKKFPEYLILETLKRNPKLESILKNENKDYRFIFIHDRDNLKALAIEDKKNKRSIQNILFYSGVSAEEKISIYLELVNYLKYTKTDSELTRKREVRK